MNENVEYEHIPSTDEAYFWAKLIVPLQAPKMALYLYVDKEKNEIVSSTEQSLQSGLWSVNGTDIEGHRHFLTLEAAQAAIVDWFRSTDPEAQG